MTRIRGIPSQSVPEGHLDGTYLESSCQKHVRVTGHPSDCSFPVGLSELTHPPRDHSTKVDASSLAEASVWRRSRGVISGSLCQALQLPSFVLVYRNPAFWCLSDILGAVVVLTEKWLVSERFFICSLGHRKSQTYWLLLIFFIWNSILSLLLESLPCIGVRASTSPPVGFLGGPGLCEQHLLGTGLQQRWGHCSATIYRIRTMMKSSLSAQHAFVNIPGDVSFAPTTMNTCKLCICVLGLAYPATDQKIIGQNSSRDLLLEPWTKIFKTQKIFHPL